MNLNDAKVLVVDDDPLMRRFIAITLNKICVHEIRDVPDGAQALATASEFLPDVILSDVHMSPMSGMEFVRQLRALPNRALSKTAVIMLSADDNDKTFQLSVPLGIFGHLPKPPNANALKELIERALKFKNHT